MCLFTAGELRSRLLTHAAGHCAIQSTSSAVRALPAVRKLYARAVLGLLPWLRSAAVQKGEASANVATVLRDNRNRCGDAVGGRATS